LSADGETLQESNESKKTTTRWAHFEKRILLIFMETPLEEDLPLQSLSKNQFIPDAGVLNLHIAIHVGQIRGANFQFPLENSRG